MVEVEILRQQPEVEVVLQSAVQHSNGDNRLEFLRDNGAARVNPDIWARKIKQCRIVLGKGFGKHAVAKSDIELERDPGLVDIGIERDSGSPVLCLLPDFAACHRCHIEGHPIIGDALPADVPKTLEK